MFTNQQQKKDVYTSLLEATNKSITELTDLIDGKLEKVTLIFSGSKKGSGRPNSLAKLLTMNNDDNIDLLKYFLAEYRKKKVIEKSTVEQELKEINKELYNAGPLA